jgi:hypothetical protein
VSSTPRDTQEDPRRNFGTGNIQPDWKAQFLSSNDDISNLDLEDTRQEGFVKRTKQFIQLSKEAQKAYNMHKQSELISRTQTGKVTKPMSKKQRNRLEGIPKDSIVEYLKNRK